MRRFLTAVLLALFVAAPAQADMQDDERMAIALVSPVMLHAQDVPDKIRIAADGKPVLLVFYASWCLPCRKEMPGIADLMRQHQLDFVRPVFISIDHHTDALAFYLLQNNYHTLFEPYMVLPDEQRYVPDYLARTGSHFINHIPYVAVYNRQGKLAGEALGEMSAQDLLALAQRVK